MPTYQFFLALGATMVLAIVLSAVLIDLLWAAAAPPPEGPDER